MCLCVYLATDRPIHTVPWLDERPAFHVDPIAAEEQAVRDQFSLPHVYYVGSHTRCGCGFSHADEPDAASQQASVAALISCVERLNAAGSVELFVCWEGDYTDAPDRVLEVEGHELAERIHWLSERSFAGERSLIHVSSAAA